MEKYVLFSPIGTTDPITGNHDGAMLHICRKYRPFKVYMYLSQEMLEYRDKDDRYRYSLEQLSERLGISFEMKEIERPELEDVQRFDIFYKDFESLLKEIQADHSDSKILLNVSSGTPAMKSALQLIAALDERFSAIQVDSPNRGSNKSKEYMLNYNAEKEWENNNDNCKGEYKDRSVESPHLNLLARLKREMIIKHIDVYDYQAALSIARDIEQHLSAEAIRLLEASVARLQLNKDAMDKLFEGTSYEQQIIPVRSRDERNMMEFLLWLQIKLKRGDLADFIRGITPVVADLLEQILLKKHGVDIFDYCEPKINKNNKSKSKGKTPKLICKKLQETETGRHILELLNQKYSKKGYTDNMLSSAQMTVILKGYEKNDPAFQKRIQGIRDVEERVRNLAAHEIVSITPEWIKKTSGFAPEEIMDNIRKLASDAQMKINADTWKSYDRMNDMIKQHLVLEEKK